LLYFSVSARIVFVSFMFECRLVISKGANMKCGYIGVSYKFWSRSVAFFMLNMFGSTAILLIFCVNSLDSL
jgi:hypothetical protein